MDEKYQIVTIIKTIQIPINLSFANSNYLAIGSIDNE